MVVFGRLSAKTLHSFVRREELVKLQTYLGRFPNDAHARDDCNYTLLWSACLLDKPQIAKWLVGFFCSQKNAERHRRIETTAKNNDYHAALYWALLGGSKEIVKFLISKKYYSPFEPAAIVPPTPTSFILFPLKKHFHI